MYSGEIFTVNFQTFHAEKKKKKKRDSQTEGCSGKGMTTMIVRCVRKQPLRLHKRKEEGWWKTRKRVTAVFESEGSYVGSAALPLSYPTPSPVPLTSMPFCILGRHCSVAREYAACLEARKAIVAVERRAKKSPFLVLAMHSCTLFAECFESAPNRGMGFDRAGVPENRDPRILELKDSRDRNRFTYLFIYLFFFYRKGLGIFLCCREMIRLTIKKVERGMFYHRCIFY